MPVIANHTNSYLEKINSILSELISGRYYYHSKSRSSLLNYYRNLVLSLSPEEYKALKTEIINKQLHLWINAREHQVKISHRALSFLVEYSCGVEDFAVYWQFEKDILSLAKTRPSIYYTYVKELSVLHLKLFGSLDNSVLEQFIFDHYIRITGQSFRVLNRDRVKEIIETANLNKEKVFLKLQELRPFRNDIYVMKMLVEEYPQLEKFAAIL